VRSSGAATLVCVPLTCAALALGVVSADASNVLLKNTWLKSHKNRVTATSSCRIDKSHTHPNGIADDGDDGDLHMACRCDAVGLPMVSEIVNAAKFDDAVAAAKDAAKNKTKTQITGVWRFWLEHPSTKAQTQGATVPIPGSTNPDHSFEIHPVTKIGGEDLLTSFVVIPGYQAYSAKTAFQDYEARTFQVSRSGAFTSIEGKKAKYNYAAFTFTVAGKPEHVADGWFVLATIDGVVNDPRRMVIVDGTAPATLIATAKKNMRYKAVGVPRINLERIDDLIAQHPHETIPVSGAYEMIIVLLAKVP
jgi:hypothetical protein